MRSLLDSSGFSQSMGTTHGLIEFGLRTTRFAYCQSLLIADAPFAKFVIGAPGGDQARKFQFGVTATIMHRLVER